MKPTPETDAAFEAELDNLNVTSGWELARKLERERDDARAEIETMREVMKDAHDALKQTHERLNLWNNAAGAFHQQLDAVALVDAEINLAKLQPYVTK